MDCAVTPPRKRNESIVPDPADAHVFRAAPVGLGLLNGHLRFQRVNDVLARLGALPSGAQIGCRVDEVYSHVPHKVMTALRRVAHGTKGAAVMDVTVRDERSPSDANPRTWRLVFRPADVEGEPHVSVVATDVTALRRFRERSGGQLAFQELLTRVSAGFVNLPVERVDQAIGDGLRQLVEFFGVQRIVLSQSEPDGRFVVAHSYSAPGFSAMPKVVVDAAFPWLADLLRRGRVLRLCKPADLPPEAERERAWAVSMGVRAHLSIPFSVAGSPLYALSAASATDREWPQEFVPRLRLAGTIFANALARKRAEEDLQHTRESMAHMARVTTVGQLAASIAHEINQPLCAMMSNAQAAVRLLAGTEPDIAETLVALGDIISDGRRAADVIGRAREMVKRRPVQFSAQDLNQLIDGITPLVENYAMIRRVRIRRDLAASLPAVAGHGVQLQQVLTNLLVNAVDAIPPERAAEGSVLVATAFDPAGRAVVVRVADNGVGLPGGDVERAFQPFFTSKPGGLGMGLPISRSIVEAHGGRLWAERNPDGGTTFVFSVPVEQEASDGNGSANRADRG